LVFDVAYMMVGWAGGGGEARVTCGRV
jgi:hypothetical protein